MVAFSVEPPVSPLPHRSPTGTRDLLLDRLQWAAALASLIAIDKFLKYFLSSIDFPSALIGMTAIIAILVSLRRFSKNSAHVVALTRFYSPAVEWVTHRWLPCFYAPALVTLPLSLDTFSLEALAKAIVVILVGVVTVAGFTGQVALSIRAYTGTEMQPSHTEHRPIRFRRRLYASWSVLAAGSVFFLLLGPDSLGPTATSVLLLSTTILGYLAGMALPEAVKKVFHPIVLCALAPNVVAAVLGAVLRGSSYHDVLNQYLLRGTPVTAGGFAYGPGDLLFSFLGVIILCFGFKVFEQWDTLCRHAPEVFGCTVAAAGFSMLTTAILARAAGLPTELARGLVPRGATLALALPVAERLGAPLTITAAGVALTGIIGGNFVQLLMTEVYHLDDPIARGLTAAATAHGLGTAAMAAKEPEALPFAALSYALCGVSASLLAVLPPWRALLLYITG